MSTHQTYDEVAAYLSPEGPALAVALWLRAVFDLAQWNWAAELSTPELRLAVAQAFVYRGRESGAVSPAWNSAVAEALAAGDTTHPLWPLFDRSVRAELAAGPVGRSGRFAIGSRPRVLDARHELVLIISADALTGPQAYITGVGPTTELDHPTASGVPHWPITARRAPLFGHGWLVAGWRGGQLPQPGWPPVL